MIGPAIVHLGPRVSALLDGQLSAAEAERAWDHVHSCHQCRDAVEREGWVKTRLATMQFASSDAPSHLKGSLLFGGVTGWAGSIEEPPVEAGVVSAAARSAQAARSRLHLGLTGIGGGAVGAAVMGVLALGASPANAPGTLVEPASEQPFGTSFTSAITAIIDRQQPAMARRGSVDGPRDTPQPAREAGRTLAP